MGLMCFNANAKLFSNLLLRSNRPTGGKHLENDTRFVCLQDLLTHLGTVFPQIDLSQRRVTELLLKILPTPTQVVEGGHVVIDIPILVLCNADELGVVGGQPDQNAGIPNPLEDVFEQIEFIFPGDSDRRFRRHAVPCRLDYDVRLPRYGAVHRTTAMY